MPIQKYQYTMHVSFVCKNSQIINLLDEVCKWTVLYFVSIFFLLNTSRLHSAFTMVEFWNVTSYWYIIIICLYTNNICIPPSPNQFIVSVSRDVKIHMSIENGKYVGAHQRSDKRTEKQRKKRAKKKVRDTLQCTLKTYFPKLFIGVDTAKLCKNCLSYEPNMATRVYMVRIILYKIPAKHAPFNTFYSSNSGNGNRKKTNVSYLWAHVPFTDTSSCSMGIYHVNSKFTLSNTRKLINNIILSSFSRFFSFFFATF